jgi:hypothetical protein
LRWLAAVAHAARLYLWQPWRTYATPLVWVLHAAYGWIVVYLVLRALAALGLLAEPLAMHALTIGAIGGMTIGMMVRTARGHTGRPLLADRFELAVFRPRPVRCNHPGLRRHDRSRCLPEHSPRLGDLLVACLRLVCNSLLAGVVAGADRRQTWLGPLS